MKCRTRILDAPDPEGGSHMEGDMVRQIDGQ